MQAKPNVLIVDDTQDNTDLVGRILGSRYTVTTAASGSAALDSVVVERPDLILLDIVMPGMDGFETCQQLKQNSSTQDIPVVFLTAKDQARDVVRGLRLGAVDYVIKPFDRMELVARVDSIIEMLRRQQSLENLLQERTAELQQSTQFVERAKAEVDIKACIGGLQLSIPSEVRFVTQLRDYLNGCYRSLCRQQGIDIMGMDLCMNEALANAIVHGNLQVPSSLKQEDRQKFDDLLAKRQADPAYASRRVAVNYRLDDGQLMIEIEDQGGGFDPRQLPDPNDPEAMLSSGRGILLIRSFMDDVAWNESGNKISMTKKF